MSMPRKKIRFHNSTVPIRYLPRSFRTKVQSSRAAYWIYIPKRIRECEHLAKGDTVEFRLLERGFAVQKIQRFMDTEEFALS